MPKINLQSISLHKMNISFQKSNHKMFKQIKFNRIYNNNKDLSQLGQWITFILPLIIWTSKCIKDRTYLLHKIIWVWDSKTSIQVKEPLNKFKIKISTLISPYHNNTDIPNPYSHNSLNNNNRYNSNKKYLIQFYNKEWLLINEYIF